MIFDLFWELERLWKVKKEKINKSYWTAELSEYLLQIFRC